MHSVALSEPTTQKTSDAPVDLVHLRRYTMGNIELEREVLGMFADQTIETLASLRHAESAKSWREAAHTLKGAALAVGAWRVAASSQQAETADFAAGPHDEILARLERSIDEARAFVARF